MTSIEKLFYNKLVELSGDVAGSDIESLLGEVSATPTANTVLDRLKTIAAALAGTLTASVAIPTALYTGQTTVTTAGTRVALAGSQAILSGVSIKAKSTNAGLIYVGGSTVAAGNGYILSPSEAVFIEVANLNTIKIDSSINGEGVSYIAS